MLPAVSDGSLVWLVFVSVPVWMLLSGRDKTLQSDWKKSGQTGNDGSVIAVFVGSLSTASGNLFVCDDTPGNQHAAVHPEKYSFYGIGDSGLSAAYGNAPFDFPVYRHGGYREMVGRGEDFYRRKLEEIRYSAGNHAGGDAGIQRGGFPGLWQ